MYSAGEDMVIFLSSPPNEARYSNFWQLSVYSLLCPSQSVIHFTVSSSPRLHFVSKCFIKKKKKKKEIAAKQFFKRNKASNKLILCAHTHPSNCVNLSPDRAHTAGFINLFVHSHFWFCSFGLFIDISNKAYSNEAAASSSMLTKREQGGVT